MLTSKYLEGISRVVSSTLLCSFKVIIKNQQSYRDPWELKTKISADQRSTLLWLCWCLIRYSLVCVHALRLLQVAHEAFHFHFHRLLFNATLVIVEPSLSSIRGRNFSGIVLCCWLRLRKKNNSCEKCKLISNWNLAVKFPRFGWRVHNWNFSRKYFAS